MTTLLHGELLISIVLLSTTTIYLTTTVPRMYSYVLIPVRKVQSSHGGVFNCKSIKRYRVVKLHMTVQKERLMHPPMEGVVLINHFDLITPFLDNLDKLYNIWMALDMVL